MAKLLQKFLSTIPQVQTRQILGVLNELKDNGSISTLAEFNQKLTELTKILTSINPQPISRLLPGIVGNPVTSEEWNVASKWAQMDLQTLFTEAQNIADVLLAHQNVFRMTVLEEMDKAIRDLEKTIELYEFYNADPHGFSDAQYNSFDTPDSHGLPHSDPAAALLYLDSRQAADIPEAIADRQSQSLTPAIQEGGELAIAGASVVDDADTHISDRDVALAGTSASNVIDGQDNTYWLETVLSKATIAGGVKAKIRLDLGAIRAFNCIEIDPACPQPMTLVSLEYIDPSLEKTIVALDKTIEGKSVIHFQKISTDALTLVFQQPNYLATDYYYDSQKDAWASKKKTPPKKVYSLDVDPIMTELYQLLPDSTIRQVLGITNGIGASEVTGYSYNFGIDNVRLKMVSFAEKSIFVSQPLACNSVGLIGLEVDEITPVAGDIAGSPPGWSFEYSVKKRDFRADGGFIGEEAFPIIPDSYNLAIAHERLYPDADGRATFRFCPDSVAATPAVYRNLVELLTIGIHYKIQVGDDGSWLTSWADVETAISGLSEAVVPAPIYINIGDEPHTLYTVSYTVSTNMSNSADSPARKISDYMRIQQNGILRCSSDRSAEATTSNLYLQIVIRSNNPQEVTAPAMLNSYKLLVSAYDQGKFGG